MAALGARVEYLWGTLPYIALIRVAPAHHRQGVGRTLLTFLEQELRPAIARRRLQSS